MNQQEKAAAIKAIDQAESNWGNAVYIITYCWARWEFGGCPVCKLYLGGCINCIVWKATGDDCIEATNKAHARKNRRPVYDLIRKVRRFVEAQQPTAQGEGE